MTTFVVAHGSLKTGKDTFVGVGETVELDDDFVKAADPAGVTFVTQDKWLAMQEVAELQARINAMTEEEKVTALKATLLADKAPTESKKKSRKSEEA